MSLVTSISAAVRRSGGCGSSTRSPSRAVPPPRLAEPAVGITARLRHQAPLLDVLSGRSWPCMHKMRRGRPWQADPKQQHPSLAGDGGPPPRCVSTSPSAMVSYSSDPFSSLRQDIDFILLLLLRIRITSRGATITVSLAEQGFGAHKRLSCAFNFAGCSQDVQRRRSFASIIRRQETRL
jgi:hypothetical protein